MRKRMLYGLLLLILCMIAGCNGTAQEAEVSAGSYKIYRVNNAGTKLVEEGFTPISDQTEKIIEEILFKLTSVPESGDRKSIFPDGVSIKTPIIKGTDLRLEFNENYSNMNNIEEILLRAGIVKSIVQIPGVDTVEFFVLDKELSDSTGKAIGSMTADAFLDSQGEGINPYQYASLTLYFPDASGEKLVREMRNIRYSTNNTLERVVVEQVLKGPVNTKLKPIVADNVKILSVITVEGVCTINFDASFAEQQSDGNISPQVIIYALVNALCDSSGVQQVQIQIEGESNLKYMDVVDLSQPLSKNSDIIYQVETPAQTESETPAKPSVGIDQIAPNK